QTDRLSAFTRVEVEPGVPGEHLVGGAEEPHGCRAGPAGEFPFLLGGEPIPPLLLLSRAGFHPPVPLAVGHIAVIRRREALSVSQPVAVASGVVEADRMDGTIRVRRLVLVVPTHRGAAELAQGGLLQGDHEGPQPATVSLPFRPG